MCSGTSIIAFAKIIREVMNIPSYRAMVSFVSPILRDALVIGLVPYSVGFLAYLLWLRVSEWHQRPQEQKALERGRRSHRSYS